MAVKTAAAKAKDEAAKMGKTMQAVIKSLEAIDGKTKFFATPVTEAIAPGYSKVIARPMDLGTVKAKIKVWEACWVCPPSTRAVLRCSAV